MFQAQVHIPSGTRGPSTKNWVPGRYSSGHSPPRTSITSTAMGLPCEGTLLCRFPFKH